MDLSGLNVAVIGLGASGIAAARLAAEKGGDVYVSDSRTDDAVAARGADLGDGIEVELGRHDLERMVDADLVVASPGIPPDAPVLRRLGDRGVRWISEPELASRFFDGALIAITGTNGKTTTTLLVNHLLHASGIRSAAGGNVGGGLAPAASDLARLDDAPDWIVLEMSSFQLAGVDTFRPDIGVVTNLSPDHLDRYDTVDAYYGDKARLFDNADTESLWVLPSSDNEVQRLCGDAPGRRYYFGDGPDSSAFLAEDELTLRVEGEIEPLLPRADLPLLGAHNVENALAAALVARLAGAGTGGLSAGLGSARALPHRLEPVADHEGVVWINDSKATNVAATRSALTSLNRPVVLLLGGKDKGEDFGQLAEAVRESARMVIGYGDAGPRAIEELSAALGDDAGTQSDEAGPGGRTPVLHRVDGSMETVVARAHVGARAGDAVLLSPACSSFDMYESYEHRGRHFTRLARAVA
ncbi:MAG: UDP-N-acetylmuramoyl-L-alanine--D-glutamate ligase [Gemmatimonadota bacterium]|nr:UDP-N-acetylmuramoyl-L-alanine--D-glutamate ligase [Gemmatimonadota bacterium]MDE3006416.1 UDP-N-acetylmuramoyl-L-alanine--D-glutamate ligase [Gemmatimonadota bacterium]MDE3015130.1 UDP-N-acetylmuramoyl-L-alanine--D-glutamate ligase [Gemmatimonadota bacterium]